MAEPKEGSIDSVATDPIASNQVHPDHLTGLKLFTTMSALCLVGFLFLLDVSVISTVSRSLEPYIFVAIANPHSTGDTEDHHRLPFVRRCWVVRRIIFTSPVSHSSLQ